MKTTGVRPQVVAVGLVLGTAGCVADALSNLDAEWPGLMDRLREPGPRLRPHIRVFVDQAQAELRTPIGTGDRVDVLAAISGG